MTRRTHIYNGNKRKWKRNGRKSQKKETHTNLKLTRKEGSQVLKDGRTNWYMPASGKLWPQTVSFKLLSLSSSSIRRLLVAGRPCPMSSSQLRSAAGSCMDPQLACLQGLDFGSSNKCRELLMEGRIHYGSSAFVIAYLDIDITHLVPLQRSQLIIVRWDFRMCLKGLNCLYAQKSGHGNIGR